MNDTVIEMINKAVDDVNRSVQTEDIKSIYMNRMYLLGMLHGSAWATSDLDLKVKIREFGEYVVNTVSNQELHLFVG